MTCKDCIHRETCFYVEVSNDELDGVNVAYDEEAEILCDGFADRSKFIELPCKAGDYVYFTNAKGVILESKIVCVRATQSTLNFNPEHIEITLGCEKSRGLLWLNLDKTKNVYFSYEEAEQALRGRENEKEL